MDQNETLKSEIETLKASIKSSENKLANIDKEMVVAKKETDYEKQLNVKLISENVKLKTETKEIVQDHKQKLSKLENSSNNQTDHLNAKLNDLECVNANLKQQLREKYDTELSVKISSEQ